MIVEHSTQAFRMQHEAAVANLRGLGELSKRQDETNSLLGEATALLSNISGGVGRLNETSEAILDATIYQTSVLRGGFEELAQAMLEQQNVLETISSVLSRPYEARALELLQEADRALKQGMRTSGRNQREEFSDATKLLKSVLDNPIGRRNYVAWFQLGWLAWKEEQNISDAEEAFYQSSRLSAQSADLYHATGLRHLAYMQYLQDRFSNAFETIQKGLQVLPHDHEMLYDAARYAARIGRESDAIGYLEKCIDLQPQTIVMMFSEKDFISTISEGLTQLLVRMTNESRRRAMAQLESWRNAVDTLKIAEKQSNHQVTLPSSLTNSWSRAAEECLKANHVTSVGLARYAVDARIKVLELAIAELTNQLERIEFEVHQAESKKRGAIALAQESVQSAEIESSKVVRESSTKVQIVAAIFLQFVVLVLLAVVLEGLFGRTGSLYPGWQKTISIFLPTLWFFGGWWVMMHFLESISYRLRKSRAEGKLAARRLDFKSFLSSDKISTIEQAIAELKRRQVAVKAGIDLLQKFREGDVKQNPPPDFGKSVLTST